MAWFSRTPHGVRGLKSIVCAIFAVCPRSHPSRGAWIEMMLSCNVTSKRWSHPSRGAWIEIYMFWLLRHMQYGRTPHGVRGLKCVLPAYHFGHRRGRTPHGVRGLKSRDIWTHPSRWWSHPSRGAWIEIRNHALHVLGRLSRTPHGVRGLKSGEDGAVIIGEGSHPSRGAWIEI